MPAFMNRDAPAAMIVHDADLSRDATDRRQRRLRAPAAEMWDRMWDRLA